MIGKGGIKRFIAMMTVRFHSTNIASVISPIINADISTAYLNQCYTFPLDAVDINSLSNSPHLALLQTISPCQEFIYLKVLSWDNYVILEAYVVKFVVLVFFSRMCRIPAFSRWNCSRIDIEYELELTFI